MKRRKRGYKVYLKFSQVMPVVVEAFNASSAIRRAQEKAKEMTVEGEEVTVDHWVYLEKEK